MTSPKADDVHDRRITIGEVRDVLALVLQVSPWWVCVVALLVVLSMVDIDRVAGKTDIHFSVTGTTAVFLALVWLPAIIRVLGVAGGHLKTPAGDVQTGGFLDLLRALGPDVQRGALPTVIATLEAAETERPEAERGRLRDARHASETRLAQLESGSGSPKGALDQLAQQYERLRGSLGPSAERTFEMNRLVAEARARARASRWAPADVREMFAKDEGSRVMALAVMQVQPRAEYVDLICEAIENSRSAFEQYHALRAAEAHLDRIGDDGRQLLRESLERQRKPGGWITRDDPSRWVLSGELLEKLGQLDRGEGL